MSDLVDWGSVSPVKAPEPSYWLRLKPLSDGSSVIYRMRLVGLPIPYNRAYANKPEGGFITKGFFGDPSVARAFGASVRERFACEVIDRATNELRYVDCPLTIMKSIHEQSLAIYNKRIRKNGRLKAKMFNPGARFGAEIVIRVSGQGLTTRYEVSLSGKFLSKADSALLKKSKLPDLKELFATV